MKRINIGLLLGKMHGLRLSVLNKETTYLLITYVFVALVKNSRTILMSVISVFIADRINGRACVCRLSVRHVFWLNGAS